MIEIPEYNKWSWIKRFFHVHKWYIVNHYLEGFGPISMKCDCGLKRLMTIEEFDRYKQEVYGRSSNTTSKTKG